MTDNELQEIERRLESTEFRSKGPGQPLNEQTVRDLIEEVRRLQEYADTATVREMLQHPPVS
jgi:hypothetical protein